MKKYFINYYHEKESRIYSTGTWICVAEDELHSIIKQIVEAGYTIVEIFSK